MSPAAVQGDYQHRSAPASILSAAPAKGRGRLLQLTRVWNVLL